MNKNRYRNEILIICKEGPYTALQIYNKLKKNYKYLGIGTVYRNLSELVNLGMVDKIKGISDKNIYEMSSKDHISGHLICQKSGKIINIDVSNIQGLDGLIPEGFDANKIEIIFYGQFEGSKGDDCKGKITLDNLD